MVCTYPPKLKRPLSTAHLTFCCRQLHVQIRVYAVIKTIRADDKILFWIPPPYLFKIRMFFDLKRGSDVTSGDHLAGSATRLRVRKPARWATKHTVFCHVKMNWMIVSNRSVHQCSHDPSVWIGTKNVLILYILYPWQQEVLFRFRFHSTQNLPCIALHSMYNVNVHVHLLYIIQQVSNRLYFALLPWNGELDFIDVRLLDLWISHLCDKLLENKLDAIFMRICVLWLSYYDCQHANSIATCYHETWQSWSSELIRCECEQNYESGFNQRQW